LEQNSNLKKFYFNLLISKIQILIALNLRYIKKKRGNSIKKSPDKKAASQALQEESSRRPWSRLRGADSFQSFPAAQYFHQLSARKMVSLRNG